MCCQVRSASRNTGPGLLVRLERKSPVFLDATAAELRRVAEEKGVIVLGSDDPPDPHGNGFVLRYWSGPNHGTIEGKYELGGTKTDGKTVEAYYVRLKLTEVIREP